MDTDITKHGQPQTKLCTWLQITTGKSEICFFITWVDRHEDQGDVCNTYMTQETELVVFPPEAAVVSTG